MCRTDCCVHEVHARNPGSLAQLFGIYLFNKVNAIIKAAINRYILIAVTLVLLVYLLSGS